LRCSLDTNYPHVRFGKTLFVAVSIAIYALMVRYHSDLPQIIKAIKPDWYEPLKSIIEQKDPSYLLIVVLVSGTFVLLLRTEKEWNFYLSFRDIIYSWVAIPYLTNKIVNLIKDSLTVPVPAQSTLGNCHPDWRVHPADFSKNADTMDRAWAELAYLQSWILNQHRSCPETTFFSEGSFAWEEIKSEFDSLLAVVAARKDGFSGSDQHSAQIMKDIAIHRKKLGRLISCYLVFMNSTRSALIVAAQKLGINLGLEPSENPLRYAAIYIAALIMAVYLGVYFSAAAYDLFYTTGFSTAVLDQNTDDMQRWIFLAFGDYGVPILGILILRYLVWRISPVRHYPIIVAYAWVFLISAVLSTFGLTIMAELVGRHAGHWDEFFSICQRSARWAIGPAFICVYINHFLDRQIDPLRPNIEPSREHPLQRIAYAFLFTLLVLATALPSMPTIQVHLNSPWDVSKLRFISMSTIFCVTMAMALAAQFALIKPASRSAANQASPLTSTDPPRHAEPVSAS
jgi:hypothetical protein